MSYLPDATIKGTLNSDSVWEIDFPPYRVSVEVTRISLMGPANSSVTVYKGTTFIDVTARGDLNSADYLNPIPLAYGQQIRLVWSTGTGNAPIATLIVREN